MIEFDPIIAVKKGWKIGRKNALANIRIKTGDYNTATYDNGNEETVQWRGNIPSYLVHAFEANNK